MVGKVGIVMIGMVVHGLEDSAAAAVLEVVAKADAADRSDGVEGGSGSGGSGDRISMDGFKNE